MHTVLSPCASVEMIPPLIIQQAEEQGIDIIAVSDHNAIDNISAVMQAAHGTAVTVLPAIELQTREEIHSLCLFDTLDAVESFYAQIRPSFPEIKNNPEFFGEQFVVDASGDFIRREERLLIVSCSLSLKEAWQAVQEHQGLLIPAHINRTIFGLLPVLGIIPTDIDIHILELSRHISPAQALQQYPFLKQYHLIQSGDAHMLEEMIAPNVFEMEAPSTREIFKAITGQDGRSARILTCA